MAGNSQNRDPTPGGTFSVARSLWESEAFQSEPFSEREAFIWMMGEAAWKPRNKRFGDRIVSLERGQLCSSIRFMAAAWGWSKSRVDRFLRRLKNRDMIGTDSGTGIVVITVCNYDDIQGAPSHSGTGIEGKPGQERDRSGTNENKGIREEEKREAKASPKKRGCRLPEDWFLSPELQAYAAEKGLTPAEIERETEKFRNYWHSKAGAGATKLDWGKTWMNWAATAAERKPTLNGGANGHGQTAREARAERELQSDLDFARHLDRERESRH